MSKTGKRLGRGLDSLVTDLQVGRVTARRGELVPATPKPEPQVAKGADIEGLRVPVGHLRPNRYQPRGAISEQSIQELAESLRSSGMIQPISARRSSGGLEIVAGERRWRAARRAGLATVPVVVCEANDRQMLEMALIENIHREDLNAVDRARAYRRYCDEFDVSAQDLAERLGEDRTTVVNYLRLLELPEEIKDLVVAGVLSMAHARCIVGVEDEEERLRLARSVEAHGLSVRALEEVIRREKRGRERGDEEAVQKPAHVRDLEERLSLGTGTKVRIREGRRRGSGRITIEYYSLDDFDRISRLLGVTAE